MSARGVLGGRAAEVSLEGGLHVADFGLQADEAPGVRGQVGGLGAGDAAEDRAAALGRDSGARIQWLWMEGIERVKDFVLVPGVL